MSDSLKHVLQSSAPDDRPRFLSEADCQDIAQRLARVARGGGYTVTTIYSAWTGNVRWARNQISTSGEVRNDYVKVNRNLNGAINNWVLINDTSDAALVAAARRAERIAQLDPELPQSDLIGRLANEPAPAPKLFFDATYQLDATQRAEAAVALAHTAVAAGMLSAGYIEVAAHAMAMIDTFGHTRYCPYTTARFSVTVRDPKGVGSGWAGVDWPDWGRIDGPKLAAIALEKCLKSCNPVAVEPGRYTTILEPQAVGDLIVELMQWGNFNNNSNQAPFYGQVGQQVMDPRLTITANPLDPDLGFPSFNPLLGTDIPYGDWFWYEVYHPVTWIKDGIFQQYAWGDRGWKDDGVFQDTTLESSGAFRMSGGETSIAEMITSTKRGLLVTRFDRVELLDERSQLQRGYTRDGLWLIENGQISKAVKNMVFTETTFFALNNIEQLGVPQRVFHPKLDRSLQDLPEPVIVPPMKVRDFSFTALSSAI